MIQTPFLKRMSAIAGALLALTSAILTFDFGLQIGAAAALALVTISFVASYMPAIVFEVFKTSTAWGIVASVVALFVIGADITTTSSTLGVYRTADVGAASLQNTKYDDNRNEVADLEKKKAFYETRLNDLKSANGWTGAMPSQAYDGQIAAKKLAIEQETAKGGCKGRCLKLTNELAELEANKATAGEHERMQAMYDATVKGLAHARDKSASTDTGHSAVQTQNLKLASIFTLQRKPGDNAMYWTDTWLMVLIGGTITLASCFFNLVAWAHGAAEVVSNLLTPETPPAAQSAAPAAPSSQQVYFQAANPPSQYATAHMQMPVSQQALEAVNWEAMRLNGRTGPARLAQTA